MGVFYPMLHFGCNKTRRQGRILRREGVFLRVYPKIAPLNHFWSFDNAEVILALLTLRRARMVSAVYRNEVVVGWFDGWFVTPALGENRYWIDQEGEVLIPAELETGATAWAAIGRMMAGHAVAGDGQILFSFKRVGPAALEKVYGIPLI